MRTLSIVSWHLMSASVSWALWAVLVTAELSNDTATRTAIYFWIILALVIPYVRKQRGKDPA